MTALLFGLFGFYKHVRSIGDTWISRLIEPVSDQSDVAKSSPSSGRGMGRDGH